MTANDPLAIPKKTLAWAERSYQEYFSGQNTFLSRAIYENWKFREGAWEYIVRLKEQIPEELERLAFEALSHTKNGFDQIAYNAAVSIDPAFKRKVYFPWADTSDNFDKFVCDFPGALPAGLKNLKSFAVMADPKSDEDRVVRKLAKLSNNKHTLSLSVACSVSINSGILSAATARGHGAKGPFFWGRRPNSSLKLNEDFVWARIPSAQPPIGVTHVDVTIRANEYVPTIPGYSFSLDLHLFLEAAKRALKEVEAIL